MPLDEVVLDYQVVGGDTSARRHLRACAWSWSPRARRWSRPSSRPSRAAGLKPEGIDLNAFALVRTLARHEPGDDAAARLLPPRRRRQPRDRGRRRTASSPARWRPTSGDDEASRSRSPTRSGCRSTTTWRCPRRPRSRRRAVAAPAPRANGLPSTSAPCSACPSRSPSRWARCTATCPGDPHRHTVAAGLALGAAA